MTSDAVDPHRFPTNSDVENRLLTDPRFSWDGHCGGIMPVIVEFMIDGFHARFRARGSHWSVIVAVPGVIDPTNDDEEFFKIESHYAEWPAAGTMPATKALEFVEAAVNAFRQVRLLTI
jgi:hypothetical protein